VQKLNRKRLFNTNKESFVFKSHLNNRYMKSILLQDTDREIEPSGIKFFQNTIKIR